MNRPPRFSVVVGTDGSTVARAAIATTLMFPWPDRAEVHGVVARRTRAALADRATWSTRSIARSPERRRRPGSSSRHGGPAAMRW
jgi:hypothetical protein